MKQFKWIFISVLMFSVTVIVSAETIGDHVNAADQRQQLANQQAQDEAQAAGDAGRDSRHMERRDMRQAETAKVTLKKTASLIIVADKVQRSRGFFRGDLAEAVRHQRFAKKQYLAGNYDIAIAQSLRARSFAIAVLRSNHARIRDNDMRSTDERQWESNRKVVRTDDQLDTDMNADVAAGSNNAAAQVRRDSNWSMDITIND